LVQIEVEKAPASSGLFFQNRFTIPVEIEIDIDIDIDIDRRAGNFDEASWKNKGIHAD